jgi:geranylgeranyl diphosphate synthase, type II
MFPPAPSIDLIHRLNDALREYSPASPGTEAHLHAALDQATSHPGRLVRAQLVHQAARIHGLGEPESLQLACAIEYYHLASLLLDDLPCMDNALTRRGQPCLHRTHGDATTILAALALINRAYALIGLALVAQPGALRVRALACLDVCLGTGGIIGGQARDLRFAGHRPSPREVSVIAAAKTGALLSLAVYFPALLGNPSERELHLLKALCLYWGLAYQGLDDLQDVLGSSIDSGKTTGRDRLMQRPNLAVALGVTAARRRVKRLLAQAGRAVSAYLVEFHQRIFVEAAARIAAAEAVAAA